MLKNRSLCPETLVRGGHKVLNRNHLFLQQSDCSGGYRSAADSGLREPQFGVIQ